MVKDMRLFVCGIGTVVAVATACISQVIGASSAFAQAATLGEAVSGEGFACSIEAEASRLTCRALGETDFAEAKHFNLDDPDRIVVDLPGFTVNHAEVYSLVDSPVIQRMRSGQRSEGARLVLDLKGRATASIFRSEDNRLLSLELSAVENRPPSDSDHQPITARSTEESDVLALPASTPVTQAVSTPGPKSELAIVSSKGKEGELRLDQSSVSPEGLLKFSVDSTFFSFEPGDRPLRDIQVTNKTEQEIFIRTYVQRVHEINSPEERYEDSKTLISSPRRFALPPLGTRSLRVVLAGQAPAEGEEMYRLILSPEPLPEGEREVTGRVNEHDVRLKVIAALGVTIALPSLEAKGVVRIESGINKVDLINSGTRAVLVENCSSCPLDSDVCSSSGKKLLHPSRAWSVPVKGSGVINCEFSMGKQKQKISSYYGTSTEGKGSQGGKE